MWIFMSESFVSLVTDRDDPNKLLVRARVEGHIEAIFPKANVVQLEDSDYRFRARVERKTVQKAIAKQLESFQYENFKSSVREPTYHEACMKVWSTMHNLQSLHRCDHDN